MGGAYRGGGPGGVPTAHGYGINQGPGQCPPWPLQLICKVGPSMLAFEVTFGFDPGQAPGLVWIPHPPSYKYPLVVDTLINVTYRHFFFPSPVYD
jgi:hypothetical protein